MNRLSVLGAGSWGTALAILAARKGLDTLLWARDETRALTLHQARTNTDYLPDFPFPEPLAVTSDLARTVEHGEVLLFAVPSHGLRKVAADAAAILCTSKRHLPQAVISASKGIENDTLLTMTEVLEETLPRELSGRIGVLSGPSFAREVAACQPTAVTIAIPEQRLCARLQTFFSTDYFRVYGSPDLPGVQLGGALKNVMAIASGISDGMGFGTNTRAALITRGLAEMARLGLASGANPLTFAGLAGLGDLVLTCTGDLSRNRQVGLSLGRGQTIERILADMRMVAEGVKTSRAAYALARKKGVEMPITEQVYRVLYEGLDPKDGVRDLLARPLRQEWGEIAS